MAMTGASINTVQNVPLIGFHGIVLDRHDAEQVPSFYPSSHLGGKQNHLAEGIHMGKE